jgi:hypothetical protein
MSLEDLTTDQLLARARQTEGSQTLIETLSRDPRTREMLQRAMKTINPALVIPEIDATDKVRAEIAERDKRIAALETQQLERDAAQRVRDRREAIKVKYRLTDADVAEVEKLMTDKDDPIPTHDAAARVYLASRTPSTPTHSSAGPIDRTYQMPEKDVWGPGIGNPAKLNRIAMDEAFSAWNDIRAGKVSGLGPASAN